MNDQNFDKLKQDFPLLYAHLSWIECGDGWFDLIYDLSGQLELLIQKYREEIDCAEDYYPFAEQVKEKYGELRFYMSTESDKMSRLIETATKRSMEICEVCGKTGKFIVEGWMMTRCEEHDE